MVAGLGEPQHVGLQVLAFVTEPAGGAETTIRRTRWGWPIAS